VTTIAARLRVKARRPSTPISVALIGADGAGKTTVGRQLESSAELPCKYIYMGANGQAGNVVLPTTRLYRALRRSRGAAAGAGPVIPGRRRTRDGPQTRSRTAALTARIYILHLMCEEVFRQIVASYYRWRGFIVVFDRHVYFDFQEHVGPAGGHRSLLHRLHGILLQRIYSRPELVICLDAPAELLLARKGEGTVEALDYWRQEYLNIGKRCPHFVVVDATQPEHEVLRQVTSHVLGFHTARLRAVAS
jgi:thymidylate kinase